MHIFPYASMMPETRRYDGINAGAVMIRMQIQLEEREARRLRERARAEDVSQAQIVREALGVYLDSPPGRDPEMVAHALSFAGIAQSALTDVSERHDDYLADALWTDLENAGAGFGDGGPRRGDD